MLELEAALSQACDRAKQNEAKADGYRGVLLLFAETINCVHEALQYRVRADGGGFSELEAWVSQLCEVVKLVKVINLVDAGHEVDYSTVIKSMEAAREAARVELVQQAGWRQHRARKAARLELAQKAEWRRSIKSRAGSRAAAVAESCGYASHPQGYARGPSPEAATTVEELLRGGGAGSLQRAVAWGGSTHEITVHVPAPPSPVATSQLKSLRALCL